MKDGPVPKVEPEHKIAATHLETNKIEEEKETSEDIFTYFNSLFSLVRGLNICGSHNITLKIYIQFTFFPL